MLQINKSVVFKYTFVSNRGSVFPQKTVEHNGMGGDFEEVHKEVVNMDVWTMLEKVKAMTLEDMWFFLVPSRSCLCEVCVFGKEWVKWCSYYVVKLSWAEVFF